MAILTIAEYKAIAPKARGFSDEAISPLLDAAEARIRDYIGDPAGVDVVEDQTLYRWSRVLDLKRPVLDLDKDNVEIVRMVDLSGYYSSPSARDDTTISNDDWKFVESSRLYHTGNDYSGGWRPGFYKITFTAESAVSLAKQCQYELVNLALVADGILQIEDGEYKERRGTSMAFGGIGHMEQRIFDKLIAGVQKIGG